jgi:membrane-bound lytic murein transglycosylase D
MTSTSSDDASNRGSSGTRRFLDAAALALLLLLATPTPSGPPGLRPPRVAGPFPMAEAPEAQPTLSDLFPAPEALQPQIDFWLRVFTEFSRQDVLIHDDWYVNVIFEVVDLSRAGARPWRAVRNARRKYRTLLAEMAADWDAPEKLSPEARRIRELYDPWPEAERFPRREASQRVRAQRGQADSFRKGLQSAGRYLPAIRDMLAEKGVPRALACLPLIESAFNPFARSHVGAAGMWQLMPVVGRQYDLTMTHLIDERRDPFIATRAAARHLAHNFKTLDSWPLAITAYNHGLQGMINAIRAVGSREIADIIAQYDHRRFGFSSRNFYPEFVAALRVFQDPAAHLGPLTPRRALSIEPFTLAHHVHARTLDRYCGLTTPYLRELNPALLPDAFAPDALLPAGARINLMSAHLPIVEAGYRAIPKRLKFQYVADSDGYRIRPGETLSEIADRVGLSTRSLARLNQIRDPRRIRSGQRLRLPGRYVSLDGRPLRPDPAPEPDRRHKVRRGETLSEIARRYGTSPNSIARANRIRNLRIIRAGQVLHIPEG